VPVAGRDGEDLKIFFAKRKTLPRARGASTLNARNVESRVAGTGSDGDRVIAGLLRKHLPTVARTNRELQPAGEWPKGPRGGGKDAPRLSARHCTNGFHANVAVATFPLVRSAETVAWIRSLRLVKLILPDGSEILEPAQDQVAAAMGWMQILPTYGGTSDRLLERLAGPEREGIVAAEAHRRLLVQIALSDREDAREAYVRLREPDQRYTSAVFFAPWREATHVRQTFSAVAITATIAFPAFLSLSTLLRDAPGQSPGTVVPSVSGVASPETRSAEGLPGPPAPFGDHPLPSARSGVLNNPDPTARARKRSRGESAGHSLAGVSSQGADRVRQRSRVFHEGCG